MDRLFLLNTKLPGQVCSEVATRAKRRRKRMGYTQAELAAKSGVSLSSLRRFEQTGSISFESLIAISFALGCQDELDALFSAPAYASIEEVIHETR